MESEMEAFLEHLRQHPEEASRLKKSGEMAEFKEKFSVHRASPLKCPACRDQWGGTLWMNDHNPYRFVCRRCKLIFHIDCDSQPIDVLIKVLREKEKEGKNG